MFKGRLKSVQCVSRVFENLAGNGDGFAVVGGLSQLDLGLMVGW